MFSTFWGLLYETGDKIKLKQQLRRKQNGLHDKSTQNNAKNEQAIERGKFFLSLSVVSGQKTIISSFGLNKLE